MENFSGAYLWNSSEVSTLLSGICVAPGTADHAEFKSAVSSTYSEEHCHLGLPLYAPSIPSLVTESKCSYCNKKFEVHKDQVAHYQSDWHWCNMKRILDGKTALTDQFLNNTDETVILSGSDGDKDSTASSSDSENETQVLNKTARVYFLNSDNQIVSLYRCILCGKKDVGNLTEGDLIKFAKCAPRHVNWAIIMLGGGHFAAGVFKGDEVIIHKTFHSYTVRGKQGGSQRSRDGQNPASCPRSAGASLRRYNEQAFAKHVQEVLLTWDDHLQDCDLIFVRASSHNYHVLYGGKSPVLSSNDRRIRNIPFPTKRATFKEVVRVHLVLGQVICHGSVDKFKNEMVEKSKGKAASPRKVSGPREMKRNHKERVKVKKKQPSFELSSSTSDTEDDSKIELFMETVMIDTTLLAEFGSSVEDERTNVARQASQDLLNVVYTACKSGKLECLKMLYKICDGDDFSYEAAFMFGITDKTLQEISLKKFEATFQHSFGKKKQTLLHVAAENGHNDIVWFLLEHGCDPSILDANREPPYKVCQDRSTRDQFRKFMGLNPDLYDYKKASIPPPLSAEEEAHRSARQSERRRKNRKVKAEREKKHQMLLEEKRREEEEKAMFLALSDREKCALAAERRLSLQSETSYSGVRSRCFLCAKDISSLVPFDYLDYKFCSTACVHEHRTKNKRK